MTIISENKEFVIDKENISNIFYNDKDYKEAINHQGNKTDIVYEERNMEASEELAEKYWQLFFPKNKKEENKLKNYKYPKNNFILSIFTITGGTDIIHIYGNKLWYEHLRYQYPSGDVFINQEKWRPKFNGSISNEFNLKIPLPEIEREYFVYAKKVNIKTNYIKIIQQPSKENNYQLGIIINDTVHSENEVYKFLIYYYLPEEISIK